MSYETRLILFITLWILILIAYYYFIIPKVSTPTPPQTSSTNIQPEEISTKTKEQPQQTIPIKLLQQPAQEITSFTNLSFTGEWNNKYSGFQKLFIYYDNNWYLFFKSLGKLGVLGITFGTPESNISEMEKYSVPLVLESASETNFTASSTFLYKDRKLRIIYELIVKTNYIADIYVRLQNLENKELVVDELALLWYGYLGETNWGQWNETTVGYFDTTGNNIKEVLKQGLFGKGETEKVVSSEIVKFVYATTKYFAMVIEPEMENYRVTYKLDTSDPGNPIKYLEISSKDIAIGKGGEAVLKYKVYMGPRQKGFLAKFDPTATNIINYGIFGFIMEPLYVGIYKLLEYIYIVVRNWGIAIILFALLMKLLLLPFTRITFVSAKRMEKIRPKLMELQQKYKDNPQELNKRLAELYRQEGINPTAGCLPLLLQIPIFFALYDVLTSMLSMKKGVFLWIKDLTLPDRIAHIEFLKYTLIIPTDINLLPIIMTALSVIYSLLTSTESKKFSFTTILFPILFLFIFWNLPSGLVLYWTAYNLLSIVEGFIIKQTES